jgi:hypothetical protein
VNVEEAKVVQINEQRRALQQLAMLVTVGLHALSQRLITAIALLFESVMFGWAMFEGGWDRLAIASVFAAAAWCLVHLRPGVTKGVGDDSA